MKFHYKVGTASIPLPSLGGSMQRFRPLIVIRLTGPSDCVVQDGLLDTSADDTVFHEKAAADIGLDLTHAPQVPIHLAGRGGVPCRYAKARLMITDYIETYEWDAMVGFVPTPIKYPLLGHAGFLQFFDAEFRGADKEVILIPNRDFPGKVS